uniref:Putative Alpha/beta-Hydrolases superfamily protein n=1 Tax=Davidia involucrata TaxID=16924 RepID=A0A5B7AI17_DAVIN
MASLSSMRRSLHNIYFRINLLNEQVSYQRFVYNVNRYQSQWSKAEKVETDVLKKPKDASQVPARPKVDKKIGNDSEIGKYNSDDDDLSDNKWKPELAWITKALEPALQLCRWALPTGNGIGSKFPPSSRSVSEIIASIQRSKLGLQDWSLSDLTIGLYLIYLRQASANPFEDVKGIQITSDLISSYQMKVS